MALKEGTFVGLNYKKELRYGKRTEATPKLFQGKAVNTGSTTKNSSWLDRVGA